MHCYLFSSHYFIRFPFILLLSLIILQRKLLIVYSQNCFYIISDFRFYFLYWNITCQLLPVEVNIWSLSVISIFSYLSRSSHCLLKFHYIWGWIILWKLRQWYYLCHWVEIILSFVPFGNIRTWICLLLYYHLYHSLLEYANTYIHYFYSSLVSLADRFIS